MDKRADYWGNGVIPGKNRRRHDDDKAFWNQEPRGTQINVHNVDERTAGRDLRKIFTLYCRVINVHNHRKGYAFITYSSMEETQRAMYAIDGGQLLGRRIKCRIAIPRE